MVNYKDILASNSLISNITAPRTAVFVGGTSGIGKYTARALVGTGTNVRIYLVGRKGSEDRTRTFIEQLNAINPKAEIVWLEAEVSLLSETQRVCDIIKNRERSIDLLFLTTGYAPFGRREETTEGLEITQSLECYTRMLFIFQLLPLLRRAEAPKVVSVLGGGKEMARTFKSEDLELKQPGNFSILTVQGHYIAMNSMTLEKLAIDNPDVTFIHSWPGAVNTGNVWRGVSDPNSIMGWVVWLIIDPVIRLFTYTEDESGQRHLFQSTSALFGGRGVPWSGEPGQNSFNKQADGLFLVNHRCECTPNEKHISLLRETAQEKIWNHTLKTLSPYL